MLHTMVIQSGKFNLWNIMGQIQQICRGREKEDGENYRLKKAH